MEDLLTSGAERIDHPALYAHTLYRLGVLEMDAGESASARRYLLRLVDLWGESDWPLDFVTDARDRLAALSAGAGR